MSAYVIVSYDIVDPEGYEGYVPAVVPLLARHGAEILVADYDAEALEGDKRTVYVVLRFESAGAARAWYHDPDYEPLKKQRLEASGFTNMVLAKAFTPPPG